MKARDIMTANPACCTPDDTVERAAHLMEENDCGCIPVVEGSQSNCVIGVITDRDIAVRGVGHGRSPDVRVADLMTDSPYCCSADSDVRDIEGLMSDRQVRRVVIVDEDGCCVGIVAQADLARAAEEGREVSDEEVGRVVEKISEPSRSNWRL
ncbi:MAG: CBS domain-containing protein [Gemmatimonadota bacterium]